MEADAGKVHDSFPKIYEDKLLTNENEGLNNLHIKKDHTTRLNDAESLTSKANPVTQASSK